MPEKAKGLESLTNSEIAQRLAKIAKRVPQTFGILIAVSLLMTFAGFGLNHNGYPIAGGIVSISGALFVFAGAFYLRKMRLKNEELIEESIKRSVEN